MTSLKIPPLPPGFLEELGKKQGARPFDIRSLEHAPGPFYEGFEEDVKRMRRGEAPLGPLKA